MIRRQFFTVLFGTANDLFLLFGGETLPLAQVVLITLYQHVAATFVFFTSAQSPLPLGVVRPAGFQYRR
ncbi:Uncharacterised protein [Serratia fonticola]|uniref:Uncharacterized protein n=1 Tax=Serratia fonticola TaxID=47917 RepID=A0A4V6KMV5_SERFO|nr:Uncharacterised protein [Serratia fonticola]